MPPSSRKRNKGKDRKAKKIESERLRVHNIWTDASKALACDHGCNAIPDDFVSAFLDEFYEKLFIKDVEFPLKRTFETHLHVFNDDSHRKMLLDVLIRIGTNLLLVDYTLRSRTRIDALYIAVPLRIAELVLSLEEYGKTKIIDSAFESSYAASKRSYLLTELGSTKRDVLKFYRRRTSCSCLKEMHLKARKIMPKMGICFGCGEEKRASFVVQLQQVYD